jgi:CubicO group peptidase (beta-lactamase class C family)
MEVWLTLMVLGAGGVILAIAALWIYVSATATPLHPNAQAVPSETRSAPLPKWNAAVERGRELMRAAVAEQNLPGASVAVGVGGELAWQEGFGFADLDQRVPVTPAHRFRIGNASIALTSAAVGLLLEKGRLGLDDVIQTHVPEFPEKKWPVTLRQVMGHVAGIRSDGGDEGPLFSQHCQRPIDGVRHIARGDLRFEPGTEFRFSNFGWILVSAAIEAAAGEPFLTFMQERIFDPLEMHDTMAEFVSESLEDRATSYFPRFAADPRYGPDPMREIDLSCYSGGSAFMSSPADLVRFGMAITAGKLLQPGTVQLLQSAQRLSSGRETGYGLGWDLDNVTLAGEPTLSAGHDGEVLGGIVGSLVTFPTRGIVVAVLSNTSYADTFAVASRIAQAFAQ